MLGLLAGGIAVAQLAKEVRSGVLRLEKLWREVQDVPETISGLMEQIECLEPALWEAERQFSDELFHTTLWNDAAAQRSFTYCRRALERLSDVTIDLSEHVSARKGSRRLFTGVKVALRKEQLRSLERKLESAIRILQISQHGYLMGARLSLEPWNGLD